MTLPTRLPLLVGAALAATLAAMCAFFAFFLLAQGSSPAAQSADLTPDAPAAPQPREVSQERLPQALTTALTRHNVVVLAWFAPLDSAAMAEAGEGARLAGAGFVRVNVMKEPSALAFAEDHAGLESPAVLVFTRGPKLRSRIPGTPDRDVVAQAAANAG